MILPLSTRLDIVYHGVGSAFISPQADLSEAIYLYKLRSDSVWYQSFACDDTFAGRIDNDRALSGLEWLFVKEGTKRNPSTAFKSSLKSRSLCW